MIYLVIEIDSVHRTDFFFDVCVNLFRLASISFDFFMRRHRCGACKGFVGAYEELSVKYINAVFLVVDTEKCEGAAAQFKVTAMPTFVILRDQKKLDHLEGAKKDALEAKIKIYYTTAGEDDCGVKGMVNIGISWFISACILGFALILSSFLCFDYS